MFICQSIICCHRNNTQLGLPVTCKWVIVRYDSFQIIICCRKLEHMTDRYETIILQYSPDHIQPVGLHFILILRRLIHWKCLRGRTAVSKDWSLKCWLWTILWLYDTLYDFPSSAFPMSSNHFVEHHWRFSELFTLSNICIGPWTVNGFYLHIPLISSFWL